MAKSSNFLDDTLLPFVGRIGENKVIKAIQYGAMATMPLTLGVSLIAVLANLPFAWWQEWLTSTGINIHTAATIKATMEITALYMTFMIGYYNAKLRDGEGITGGIIALGSLLILIPHTIAYEGGSVPGFSFDYLGGNAIFGGMILAIVTSSLYIFLSKKGLVIKLPASVPPMVAQSLSPTFIAIVIFMLILLVRIGFGFTPYGNYIDFVTTIAGGPIILLGTSMPSITIFFVLTNVCWFFGIHPNTIISVYIPVLMMTGTANLTAFMSGAAMPYLAFSATYMYGQVGGTGNTLGLALLMPFISKSERFKSLGKLSIMPAVFNINEPLIFGMPIMLNPIFLPPLIITAIVNAVYAYFVVQFGIMSTLNPTIGLPWIMPMFITPIFTIGILGVVAAIGVIVIDALIYLPFFKKADSIAYKEEQAQAGGTN